MKNLLLIAGLLGVLGVVLGAFGAHGLKMRISPEQLTSYQTGITYHFYHVFAILIAGVLYYQSPQKIFMYAGICFLTGIILFSGSIYLLATKDLMGITNARLLGPITPIGGLFFITGWLMLTIGIYNRTA